MDASPPAVAPPAVAPPVVAPPVVAPPAVAPPLSILTIGDPHFKVSNARETSLMTTAFLKLTRSLQPDAIVVMGDTLDTHEHINLTANVNAVKFMYELSLLAPLYVLIGNHDRRNNADFMTDNHPFTALKAWANTTVVDKTLHVIIKGQPFTFVPYVPPGRFLEALNRVELHPPVIAAANVVSTTPSAPSLVPAPALATNEIWRGSHAIFAHQEFKGAKMGPITSLAGDEWDASLPIVISGHIHDFYWVARNILYVGTPIQHGYGDHAEKTVSAFTFTNGRMEHKQYDLGVPKKIIVRLAPEEVSSFVPEANREYKVIIKGTTTAVNAVMKLPIISQWIADGIKVHRDIIALDPVVSSAVSLPTLIPTKDGPQEKYSVLLRRACSSHPLLARRFDQLFPGAAAPHSISIPTII